MLGAQARPPLRCHCRRARRHTQRSGPRRGRVGVWVHEDATEPSPGACGAGRSPPAGVHLVAACMIAHGNLENGADVTTGSHAPAQEQSRRPDPHAAHRRRRSRHGAGRGCDRLGRLRPQRRRLGATARLASSGRHRRLLAGLCRRRHAARLHALGRGAQPGVLGSDPRRPQDRHRGDRGPALLQEQRRRSPRHLPRGRQGHRQRRRPAGRLHDHDAADAQPLPGRRQAHDQAEDHRGEAGAGVRETSLKASDPHELPQQRPLRHRRRADRHRRAGGGAHLLRQTGQPAQPAASGTAGRPAAGAVAVQPLQRHRRRTPAPQRGAREDARPSLHHGRTGGAGADGTAGSEARLLLLATPGELLLRIRAPTVDQPLREQHGGQGRPACVHDDRPGHAAPGSQGHQRSAQPAGRPCRGDRDAESGKRRHRGNGRVPELRPLTVQSRLPGASPARIDVQGDRARRCPLTGRGSQQHLLPLSHAGARLAADVSLL